MDAQHGPGPVAAAQGFFDEAVQRTNSGLTVFHHGAPVHHCFTGPRKNQEYQECSASVVFNSASEAVGPSLTSSAAVSAEPRELLQRHGCSLLVDVFRESLFLALSPLLPSLMVQSVQLGT